MHFTPGRLATSLALIVCLCLAACAARDDAQETQIRVKGRYDMSTGTVRS